MRVDRGFTLPVPVDGVWAALTDLDRVGALLSCAKGHRDQRRFSGVLAVRLGPFALEYRGSGRVIDVDDVAHRILVEAAGVDIHGGGTAAASVTVTLQPHRHGRTRVAVGAELSASGQPVRYAGQSLRAVAARLVDRFGRALAAGLAGDLAMDVAGGLAGDPAARGRAEPDSGPDSGPVRRPVPVRRRRWFLPYVGLVFMLGGGVGWLVARLVV